MTKRTTIYFSPQDEAILKFLNEELTPKYGSQSVASIVRMSIRALLEQQKEKV